jgi:NitT/TauT family transport system permease protein
MARSSLTNDLARLTPASFRWRTLSPVLTFASVMIVLIAVWQGIKARYNLPERTLPHVAEVLRSLTVPIQENGPTLGTLLVNSALFTFREALLGFFLGATVGFALAILFAHSRLLERGIMPYVVASQTVPILAIAPMVVIWLRAEWLSVAVISAYLTFFPVTINTLRGLQSVTPTALELMQSYAATRWQTLTKLLIPQALPYIFTALKVSATASVVGAIIGELPSGIQDGLGYQILNYSQYYIQGPSRLWATILVAALLGITAFLLVALVEKLIVRWSPPDASQ